MKYLLILLILTGCIFEAEVVEVENTETRIETETETITVQRVDTVYLTPNSVQAQKDSLDLALEIYEIEVQAIKDSLDIETKKGIVTQSWKIDTVHSIDTVLEMDTIMITETVLDTVIGEIIATIYFDTTFYDTTFTN